MEPLPVLAPLGRYEDLAASLLVGHRTAAPAALAVIHRLHPRHRDAATPWKVVPAEPSEVATAPFDLGDARLVVARGHDSRDWDALASHVRAVHGRDGAVRRFELAVEAVVDGDLAALATALAADPGLIAARSSRVTGSDPPAHRATLLHYLAANGVEGHRQRCPANAVDVARLLLSAGASPDALAVTYGGEFTTLTLLVSSSPPFAAKVQVPLVHALIDAGAAVDGCGTGRWRSPLRTAIVFGFVDAARALAARGAAVNDVVLATGLGDIPAFEAMLPSSTAEQRHAALAVASQLGHAAIVARLLAAGEDADRFNPDGCHGHGTPLHHAALHGHLEVVRLLVAGGARVDRRDRIWNGTAVGWAEHGGHADVAAFLRAQVT
ncbi:MAG: ankyrin repeat domain-containing protein [Planctomycetota bacterium]